jgi:hypothetical protein
MRQDPPADHCRRRVGFADRLQDALDPVRGRDRVVVDVGDIFTTCFPSAGIARRTDTRLLDTQQSRVAAFADLLRELNRGIARRGAVHHQNVELFVAGRLAPQALKAIAQIARPVMRADADGEDHAPSVSAAR